MHQGHHYLGGHPIGESDALVFLKDAKRALELSKSLSQNGYIAGPFLSGVAQEMERVKDGLLSGGSDNTKPSERMLAEYLEAAV